MAHDARGLGDGRRPANETGTADIKRDDACEDLQSRVSNASLTKITRHLKPPDDDGVVDVNLFPEPPLGLSYLEGYFGPWEIVAKYARDDLVRIRSGSGRAAMLVKVTTDDSHRRRGIGTALVKDFLELCRAEHVDAVYLYAQFTDENIDLVRWYERLGFKRLYPHEDRGDPEMIARLIHS